MNCSNFIYLVSIGMTCASTLLAQGSVVAGEFEIEALDSQQYLQINAEGGQELILLAVGVDGDIPVRETHYGMGFESRMRHLEMQQRPEPRQHPDAIDRDNLPQNPAQNINKLRVEQPARPESIARPARGERPEIHDRPERLERPEKPDRPEKPGRPDRPHRPGR